MPILFAYVTINILPSSNIQVKLGAAIVRTPLVWDKRRVMSIILGVESPQVSLTVMSPLSTQTVTVPIL